MVQALGDSAYRIGCGSPYTSIPSRSFAYVSHMPASDSPTPSTRPRLVDSPWYWAYLFGVAGLAGLMLIGPKFSQRQERLETRQSGRENAWKHRVQGEPLESSTAGEPGHQSATVRPSTPRPLLHESRGALIGFLMGLHPTGRTRLNWAQFLGDSL